MLLSRTAVERVRMGIDSRAKTPVL